MEMERTITPEQQAQINQIQQEYLKQQAQAEAEYLDMVEGYRNTPQSSPNILSYIITIIITIIIIKFIDRTKKTKEKTSDK